MKHLTTIASGIFGILLASTPVSATNFNELTLFFASSAAIENAEMQPASSAPALEDNAVLSAGDVFKVASAGGADAQPGGLFKNTDLSINIQSASNDIAHTEVLGHCKSLDLVTDSTMFGQSAICDKQTFSYTVDGNMIVILKDSDVFREYELTAGNYMINGYPVIFN